MRLLIVEDDPHKLNRLVGTLSQLILVKEIERASSLRQAMMLLELSQYDFVILDMAIPSHAGDAGSTDIYSQPVGGLDILMHLALNERPEAVIIVTQYPTVEYNQKHVALSQLIAGLAEDDVTNVRGVILFDEDERWKSQLTQLLEAAS